VKLKVLVVGATGSIGSLVVKEAVRQGHKVRALVRSESKGRQLPSEAEAVVGDPTRSESLAVAVQGMEAIVFTHGSDGGGKKGAEGVVWCSDPRSAQRVHEIEARGKEVKRKNRRGLSPCVRSRAASRRSP
jgi:uncharacterized protein YbjT (DUF2867 family)